jgi:hypothetical protein
MVRQDVAGNLAGQWLGIEDDQVVAKTGKPLQHWVKVLDRFGADSKRTAETVDYLQDKHGVPRSWARTLVTTYAGRHG